MQSNVTETLNDECLASPTGCRAYENIDDVSEINIFETLNMHTDSTHIVGFVDKVFQSVENSSACCRDTTMDTALIDWFSWYSKYNRMIKWVKLSGNRIGNHQWRKHEHWYLDIQQSSNRCQRSMPFHVRQYLWWASRIKLWFFISILTFETNDINTIYPYLELAHQYRVRWIPSSTIPMQNDEWFSPIHVLNIALDSISIQL